MTTAATVSVLLADDNPSKRYVLASYLRRAGYHVIEAQSGGETLTMLAAEPVDAVVLDVRLPDMSGFEVCEAIRAQTSHDSVPIIHVSAHATQPEDRTRGLSGGADAYLVEPIDPGELVATVNAVMRYYQARRQAERLANRLAKLARTSIALSAATTLPEVLGVTVTHGSGIFEAPMVVVAESSDGHRLAAAAQGPGDPPRIRPWAMDRHDRDVPLGSTVTEETAERWPLVSWPAGDDAVRVVAARARPDRPPVFIATLASASDEGAPVLTQLAQAVVAAIEAMRSYDEERRIALTLQRSLLPRRLPRIPGLDVAGRYVPASARTEVGGDFYELEQLNGKVIAAIGDVVGHSLHAATVMAELRHAIRAYVVEGHRPGAVLNWLNTLMMRLIPDEIATVCLLELDPVTGHVRMANAGHPPPLISVDGEVSFVEHRAPLLGIRADRPPDIEFTLPPGGTLVLYTDGLVERRGQVIDEGLQLVAQAAAHVDDDLEKFCERLLVEAVATDSDDDLAVLVLRRH